MQISQPDCHHNLTVVTFSSGSVCGAAATTGIWSSSKKLCFSEKVSKMNFCLRVQGKYSGCKGLCSLGRTGIYLKDTQPQEDAQDLSACGERWRREGCNINSNLFRNLRIHIEMRKTENEAYKSSSCWEVSESIVTDWAGENRAESLPQSLTSSAF